MTLVTRLPQITPWCDSGAVGPSADRVVLTSSDTALGYQFGASALGRQKENGLFWDIHSRALYHLQGGAPEWGADTDYREGALVTHNGGLWRADYAHLSTLANAPSSSQWVRIGGSGYGEWHIAGSFSWTVPRGCNTLQITMIGGGGGGGSGGGVGLGTDKAGAGGSGGGGATHVTFTVYASPLDTIAVVVGAGGGPNTDGGDTTVTVGGKTYVALGAGAGRAIVTPTASFTPGRWAGGRTARGTDPLAVNGMYKGDIGFQDLLSFGAMLPDAGRGGWGGLRGGSGGDGYGPYLGYGSGGRDIYAGAPPARCGGCNNGNLGGFSGTSAGVQNFGAGGGGGGAGSIPRALCVHWNLDPCIGGNGGSTTAFGTGITLNAGGGEGPGSGGGGGAGAGGTDYGTQPGSLAGSGADGLVIIEYFTF